MSKMKTKLLKVIWDDSAMYNNWYDKEELRAMIRDWKTVKTVGYLILEDENRIVLAGSIDGSGDKYSNITVIPNSAIITKEELKPPNVRMDT